MNVKTNIKIRSERQNDFDEIYELIKTAFQTAKNCDGDEQDYAAGLRKKSGYIPELALVAEYDGKLIGQIMLTKTYINMDTEKIESLLLSPLSVAFKHRGKGVGAMLVTEALSKAKAMGYKAVFLCGDPEYYGRFGFKTVVDYGIIFDMDISSKYVMVCELEASWLKDKKGSISIV